MAIAEKRQEEGSPLRHEVFFRNHPVFRGEEFGCHLKEVGVDASRRRSLNVRAALLANVPVGTEKGICPGPRTKETLLGYFLSTGRIMRIRRDLYAVDPNVDLEGQYHIDPYLIASKLAEGAVVSHHAALALHGRAHSVMNQITYLARRPARNLDFRGQTFVGRVFPKVLLETGKELEETKIIYRQGAGGILTTTLERTLVDALDRLDLSGGWEEVWHSLGSVEYFDLDRVVAYALLLKNATLAATVGFYLELRRNSLFVSDKHLDTLQKRRPKKPHYMERSRRQKCVLVNDWNLFVPERLLDETWREKP